MDGADEFVGGEGVAFDAGVEGVDGDAPGAAHGGGLHLGSGGEQRGVAVAGRGGGAEVAADAAPVADLRGADGAGGEGERGQRPGEVVEDGAVGDGGAEPYRPFAGFPAAQFGDAGQIEEPVGAAPVEGQLDHHIGAAGDRYGVGVCGFGGQCPGPVGGAEKVHAAVSPWVW